MGKTTTNLGEANGENSVLNDTFVMTKKKFAGEFGSRLVIDGFVFRAVTGTTGFFDEGKNLFEVNIGSENFTSGLIFKYLHGTTSFWGT